MKQLTGLRLALTAMAVMGSFCATQAMAQVPPRFYLKNLEGGNAVPVIINSLSGNTNPFDSSNMVISPEATFDSTMVMAGFAHNYSLFDRAAMAAVILPMGRISGEALLKTPTGTTKQANQEANGFGDPMLEFTINLIGPGPQRNIPDAMRYEPGLSLDLLADVVLPIGEYNNNQQLNIGQNRWYTRLGMPVIWQLGDWVPGRRTTLEFLPLAWIYGDNTDYVGQTLSTKPLYQLDAHLTRDFTSKFWGSLDAVWYNGGQATISGPTGSVTGSKLNNMGVGLTLGFTLNDNMSMTVGYKSAINNNAPGDMKMDGFMFSFVYGWHPLFEGFNRLKGN